MINATPRQLYPQEKDWVPIVQEAGWTPKPGQVRKILPPPESDPGTAKPLAISCNNYDIWAHEHFYPSYVYNGLRNREFGAHVRNNFYNFAT